MKQCAIGNCESIAIKRGWCGKHYQRWRTGGNFERSILDPNEITIHNSSVASITLYSTNQNGHREVARTLIDSADLQLVRPYKWHYDSGYVATIRGKRKLYLHRLLMPSVPQVDHKNLNRLDNRRSNLRPATRSQNLSNIPKRQHNTSGYKNVMYDLRRNKWYVQISFEGHKKFAGYFTVIEDAVIARDKLLGEMHGKFARS